MAPPKLVNRTVAFFFLILLPLLLAACDRNSPQSTFGTEGPVARQQLGLFWLIFWIAVVVFVLVEGLLLYSIIKFRRKPGEQGLPPQTHGNTRLEIAWTVVPVILLVIVAVPTFVVIADQNTPPEDANKVNVQVVAHQWWWEFRYPDLGIVTANELRIPAKRVIDITLESQDVIHSFWVPKLAGKTDVVPNRVNRMWFVADEEATYFGQCGEFCGLAHAQMRFRVVSQSQGEFDAWVRAQKAPPAGSTDQLVAKGQQLFGSKGCLVCHAVNGTDIKTAEGTQAALKKGFEDGASLFPAPNLTTFATRGTFAGGLLPLDAGNLAKWLRNPEGVKPGNRMAELAAAYQGGKQLPQEEVEALAAYLMSLKTDPNARPVTPTPAPTTGPSGTPTPGSGSPVPGGKVELKIGTKGNDLAFDLTSMVVKAGSDVTVTLANNATSKALQHNWVLVKKGTEDKVGVEGLGAGAGNNWVPRNSPDVIAFVPLADGGSSKSATFKAPAAGTYGYICSFPGHPGTMRGTFEVQP